MSNGLYGLVWFSLFYEFLGCLLVSMRVYGGRGCLWVFGGVYGCMWVSMGVYGLLILWYSVKFSFEISRFYARVMHWLKSLQEIIVT